MADQGVKNEVSKDVLAPTVTMREDLIATAVKFLQNPKVRQSPLGQKKSFLEKKGLTQEEVEAAIERSGVTQTDRPEAQTRMAGPPSSATTAVAVPNQTQAMPYSSWMKARDVLAVVTMVAGISYAANRLYKEYLRPWLTGLPGPASRMERLENTMSEMQTRTQSSLTTILDTLTEQQEKLQLLSHELHSKTGSVTTGTDGLSSLQSNQSINEIKTELTSIKGLLLNRRQFPPPPASSPVLPSWQLTSSQKDSEQVKEASPPSSPTAVTMATEPDTDTDASGRDTNQKSDPSNARSLEEMAAVTFSETPSPQSCADSPPQLTEEDPSQVKFTTEEGEGQETEVKVIQEDVTAEDSED